MTILWTCEELACANLGTTEPGCIAICLTNILILIGIIVGLAALIYIFSMYPCWKDGRSK